MSAGGVGCPRIAPVDGDGVHPLIAGDRACGARPAEIDDVGGEIVEVLIAGDTEVARGRRRHRVIGGGNRLHRLRPRPRLRPPLQSATKASTSPAWWTATTAKCSTRPT